MELKNIDTFIQVAELCSFTKAAEKLGYSQSTVSFQIKQLEASLNVQLFERINHTVTLTDKGKDVLKYAHQITVLAQKMHEEIQQEHPVGHVRIVTSDSLSSWLLFNSYSKFSHTYPGITLKMTPASTEDMFRMLNQNETDLMFTLDSHIYDRDYIIAHEEKMKAHFVCSTSYPLADGSDLSLAELITHPFILTEKGMSYRRLLDEKLASMSLEIKPVLEIGNTELICQLLKQKMGISFLPDFITRTAVQNHELRYLAADSFDTDIWVQLLYHRSKWLSPQMQIVIQFLSSCCKTIEG